jgi:hypothetical protein
LGVKGDTERNGFIQSDIDFEVVNSYTTDLSCIDNIIITVDDKLTWVNNIKKQVIRQINIDNNCLQLGWSAFLFQKICFS